MNLNRKRNLALVKNSQLVPRVKKYLADNLDKSYVDIAHMSTTLRKRYNEYKICNEQQFHKSVEAAYNIVLQNYGLHGHDLSSSSSNDDDSDDLEVLDDSNALNEQLTNMYDKKKNNKKKDQPPEESNKNSGELIDISSDDNSERETQSKSLKLDQRLQLSSAEEEYAPQPVQIVREILVTDDSAAKKRKSIKKTTKKPEENEQTRGKHTSKFGFEDIGGIDHIKEQICDLVLHMKHPEVYTKLGIKAPRGALLHGPPGTGKTLLANAIAGRLQLPIMANPATELVGGVSGESEKLIREAFEAASALAPCILFLDEIDSICGNRLNAQKDMEKRMVAQLLSSIDSLDDRVLLLAATNNPDALDPSLRRAGRLEQEIALGIPTLMARKDILKILCKKLNLSPDIDLDLIAQLTPGFVGADLQALINKSCTIAVKRVFKKIKESQIVEAEAIKPAPIKENGDVSQINGEETENKDEKTIDSNESINVEDTTTEDQNDSTPLIVDDKPPPPPNKASTALDDLQRYLDDDHPFTDQQLLDMKIIQEDMLIALKTTKPCAIREGIVTVPDTTWDDVGSLADVRRDLQLAVLAPIKYPAQLEILGLNVPSGVLLCGPPGCGKTLLAKAVANEAGINFISVKGPELLNMYVGESERAVRTCFSRARNSAPCVIFFDEFDSLCPKRLNNDISGATRVVNQLLTEMDGIEGREGVFVLAATNRPDIIDPAVLRPGRLDRVLFVGMPLLEDRVDILRTITKKGTKPQLGPDVDLEIIAKTTEGYTGADLAGLVRQAATEALTDFITSNGALDGQIAVMASHFQTALAKMRPSISSKEMQHYEKLRLKYSSAGEEKPDVEMDIAESMDTV